MILAGIPVSGISVEGSPIERDIEPGSVYSQPIVLSVGPDEPGGVLTIDVLGLGQSPFDWSYTAIEEAQDTGAFTARPFISINTSTIRLVPGERAAIIATIAVPDDAGEGGRYAIVLIRPLVATPAQPEEDPAAAIPVLLNVGKSGVNESGEITALDFSTTETGNGFLISTWFRNTGNHHLEGTISNVTITNADGDVVAHASTSPFEQALIPGQEVRFSVEIEGDFPDAMYMMTTRIEMQDGSLLAEQEEKLPGTGRVEENTDSQSSLPGDIPTRRAPGFAVGIAMIAVLLVIRGIKRIASP
jgi:hypothetical protein